MRIMSTKYLQPADPVNWKEGDLNQVNIPIQKIYNLLINKAHGISHIIKIVWSAIELKNISIDFTKIRYAMHYIDKEKGLANCAYVKNFSNHQTVLPFHRAVKQFIYMTTNKHKKLIIII
ncbi:hypothetical protein TSAR_014483 [Trichomalopsis sarcophagae]|uniref:Uncharacterized protein n=1 Tax=Trichomalopsis sarcophagae TaxID=543379 RepID=A0A232EGX1_9HYME|nr:hypothetical protein TSAR_014483 [Trichomalopsis sarcophagae]